MAQHLLFWILNGSMQTGVDRREVKGKMTPSTLEAIQKDLQKKHGKGLRIVSFSKFEGRDLPIVDTVAVRSGPKPP